MTMPAEEAVETAVEEQPAASHSLSELIRSDYYRFCVTHDRSFGTNEAQNPNLVKAVLRHLTNSQLRFQVLVRLNCAAPRWLHWFFRSLLVYLHSSELGYGVTIGPEFRAPHPAGIVIGGDAKIGRNVAIAQNVTLGSDLTVSGQPIIEDDVIIMTGAVIAGGVRVGRGALVGANCVVVEDLPANSVCGPGKIRIVRGRGVDWALKRRGIDIEI